MFSSLRNWAWLPELTYGKKEPADFHLAVDCLCFQGRPHARADVPLLQTKRVLQLVPSTEGNGSQSVGRLADAALPKPTARRLCYFSHAWLDGKYVSNFMKIWDVAQSSGPQ